MLTYFYYHLHKTSLKRGKPYIKSPEWLKNKGAIINTKKNDDDDNCFQYAITAALNYNNIRKKICKEYQILNSY